MLPALRMRLVGSRIQDLVGCSASTIKLTGCQAQWHLTPFLTAAACSYAAEAAGEHRAQPRLAARHRAPRRCQWPAARQIIPPQRGKQLVSGLHRAAATLWQIVTLASASAASVTCSPQQHQRILQQHQQAPLLLVLCRWQQIAQRLCTVRSCRRSSMVTCTLPHPSDPWTSCSRLDVQCSTHHTLMRS